MELHWSESVKRLRGSERVPLAANGRDILHDLQDRYRIQLPEDFAAYVVGASPREDWMDGFGMIWWGAERIKSVRDECGDESPGGQPNAEIEDEADQYLVFADFLMWCYAYAICCSAGPKPRKNSAHWGATRRIRSQQFFELRESCGSGFASHSLSGWRRFKGVINRMSAMGGKRTLEEKRVPTPRKSLRCGNLPRDLEQRLRE